MKDQQLKNIFEDALRHELRPAVQKKLAQLYPDIKYEYFEKEVRRIGKLRNKKKGFKDFVSWYLERWEADGSAVCKYCGISEKECAEILQPLTKRAKTRSQHLEIEQKSANDGYSENNCILACYVCNNAKSDFMSEDEFKKLIPGIQAFWKSQREKKKQN